MRITLLADRCCGAGMCVMTAPDVFDHDDDGRVILVTDDPSSDAAAAAARQAAALCPTGVIEIAD